MMSSFALRRFLAVVGLVAWITGGIAPALDIHADGLVECDTTAAQTPHHQGPQLERVYAPVGDGHCVLCHLQRTMRGADGDGSFVVAHLEPVGLRAEAAIDLVCAGARRGLPARAPPALSA